jgi:alkylation response protein AidB-like acyl-CoA dehydrogenase
MWDRLTPAERAWKQECRAFAEGEIAPRAHRYDRENRFPDEVHERAYPAGMINQGIPEALGGRGLSHRMLAIGFEELAAACAPTAFSLAFNHGSLRPVLVAGTDAQKQRFVGELIARRGYASLCLTEPDASGSNLLAVTTRAVRADGGWRLTGTKRMVGNGGVAGQFLVLAMAEEGGRKRGLTFFCVPRGPGVEVGPNNDKIGFRCVETPEVRFRDVALTDAHVIGGVGGGEDVLLQTLEYIRFGGGAVILGSIVGAVREVVPWVEQRRVFPDVPLASRTSVQLVLGDILGEVRTVRTLLWDAADRIDQGLSHGTETALLKLRASELAVRATGALCQLMGWRGIDNDYGIQKRVRDARVTTIFEGTSEVQRFLLYRELRRSLAEGGDL